MKKKTTVLLSSILAIGIFIISYQNIKYIDKKPDNQILTENVKDENNDETDKQKQKKLEEKADSLSQEKKNENKDNDEDITEKKTKKSTNTKSENKLIKDNKNESKPNTITQPKNNETVDKVNPPNNIENKKPDSIKPETGQPEKKPDNTEIKYNYEVGNSGKLFDTEAEAIKEAEEKFNDFSDSERYVSRYLIYSTFDKWTVSYEYDYY